MIASRRSKDTVFAQYPFHRRALPRSAAAFFAAHGMTDPDALSQIRNRKNYYSSMVPALPAHELPVPIHVRIAPYAYI